MSEYEEALFAFSANSMKTTTNPDFLRSEGQCQILKGSEGEREEKGIEADAGAEESW